MAAGEEEVSKMEKTLSTNDFHSVINYLRVRILSSKEVFDLGVQLGLSPIHMERRAEDELSDVVLSWLSPDPDVLKSSHRPTPTWKNLCRVLKELGHDDLASNILQGVEQEIKFSEDLDSKQLYKYLFANGMPVYDAQRIKDLNIGGAAFLHFGEDFWQTQCVSTVHISRIKDKIKMLPGVSASAQEFKPSPEPHCQSASGHEEFKIISQKKQTINLAGNDFAISIPENTFKEDAKLHVRKVLTMPYKLPSGYLAASYVYGVEIHGENTSFQNKVTIQIRHSATLKNKKDYLDLVFMKASSTKTDDNSYTFSLIPGGNFTSDCGEIIVDNFSYFMVAAAVVKVSIGAAVVGISIGAAVVLYNDLVTVDFHEDMSSTQLYSYLIANQMPKLDAEKIKDLDIGGSAFLHFEEDFWKNKGISEVGLFYISDIKRRKIGMISASTQSSNEPSSPPPRDIQPDRDGHYSTDWRRVTKDNPKCIRSLLEMDNSISQTGNGANLAIVDYGFYKGSMALKAECRITFDGNIVLNEELISTQNDINAADCNLAHGTVVASIAAGKNVYNCVVQGIGRKVNYSGGVACQAALKCFSLFDKQTTILTHLQSITEAKKYDVVSMSLVINERSDCLDDAFKVLLDQDTIVLAGCGNQGDRKEIGYPACLEGVVSVGSLTPGGKPSDFTREKPPHADIYVYGEVLAPYGENQGSGASLHCYQGTSMATPAAAGLACLAIEYINTYCEANHPNMNSLLLRQKRKRVIMNVFQRCKGTTEKYCVYSAKDDFMSYIEEKTMDEFSRDS